MTWKVVPGQKAHPMLARVPGSFTFFADAHDDGPLVDFADNPSTVLMTSPGGGPAVTVREFGNGRIVNFSSAANYPSGLTTGPTLEDSNILQLYINAVAWTTFSAPEPTIQDLIDAVAGLVADRKLRRWPGFILTLELKGARKKLHRGYTHKAVRMLEVFIRHVEFLIYKKRLAPEYGEPLIDTAYNIIDRIIAESAQESLAPDIEK